MERRRGAVVLALHRDGGFASSNGGERVKSRRGDAVYVGESLVGVASS